MQLSVETFHRPAPLSYTKTKKKTSSQAASRRLAMEGLSGTRYFPPLPNPIPGKWFCVRSMFYTRPDYWWVDSTIHEINHYSVHNTVVFVSAYPLYIEVLSPLLRSRRTQIFDNSLSANHLTATTVSALIPHLLSCKGFPSEFTFQALVADRAREGNNFNNTFDVTIEFALEYLFEKQQRKVLCKVKIILFYPRSFIKPPPIFSAFDPNKEDGE